MRVLLFLGALLITSPAFALSEAAIDYCFSTTSPQACLKSITDNTDQQRRESQQAAHQQQMELARIQAQSLMLFGSGAALINGMNQGFHQMQLPYVSTPQFQYHDPSR